MSDAPCGRRQSTSSRRMVRSWNRRDWWQFGALVTAILVLHLVGFGTLFVLIAPHHYQVGTQVFGIGLGLTAYTFGLRHAFDLRPHRRHRQHHPQAHPLMAPNPNQSGSVRGRPLRSWCWHSPSWWSWPPRSQAPSTTTPRPGTPGDRRNPILRLIPSTSSASSISLRSWVSGGSSRVLRSGQFDEHELEEQLNNRGLLARILRPIMTRIKHPIQMFPVGVLFRLGFDTATEVALLAWLAQWCRRRAALVRGLDAAGALRRRG